MGIIRFDTEAEHDQYLANKGKLSSAQIGSVQDGKEVLKEHPFWVGYDDLSNPLKIMDERGSGAPLSPEEEAAAYEQMMVGYGSNYKTFEKPAAKPIGVNDVTSDDPMHLELAKQRTDSAMGSGYVDTSGWMDPSYSTREL